MLRKIACIGIALVLLVSCRKKVEWDSDWVLALFNQEMNLAKLENDSTLVNDGGFYRVQLRRNLVNLDLTSFVNIPDTTISYTKYMQFLSLTVNPGFELINSIEEHKLEMGDVQLKKINISGGRIDFQMENPIDTKVFIRLIMPGMVKNGQTVEKNIVIGPKVNGQNGVVNTFIDLQGVALDLTGRNGASYNRLQSQVVIKTDPNGPAVIVTNQQGFVVNAEFKDLKLDYARGYFGSRLINETDDFNLDLLKIVQSGTVNIPQTQIRFDIQNGVKLDLQAQLNALNSTNSSGNMVPLTGGIVGQSIHVPSATGTWNSWQPGNYSFLFNSSNSNIEAFIENLGYKYDLSYLLRLNPWGNTTGGWNEIFANSKLSVKLAVDMPLRLGVNNLVLKDTFDLSVKMSKDKTNISQGELIINYENGFPLGANLSLLFLNDLNEEIGQSQMLNGLQSSAFGSSTQNGIRVMKGEVSIPLGKDVMDRLEEIKRVVVRAHLNTTNDITQSYSMVDIPFGAFLGLKARAKFVLNTKF